jgi:hypothetical protein
MSLICLVTVFTVLSRLTTSLNLVWFDRTSLDVGSRVFVSLALDHASATLGSLRALRPSP